MTPNEGDVSDAPMGASRWKEHGIKYGYWDYFAEKEEKHWYCRIHKGWISDTQILEKCCCHHPTILCSPDAAERSESEKDPTSEVNPQTGLERSKCCGATVRLANAYEGTNLYVCSKCKLTCHLKATEEQDRQRRIEEITVELAQKMYYFNENKLTSEAIVKAVLELQKL